MQTKHIIYILLIIGTLSCEDEIEYGFDEFYDAYLVDEIYLEADKSIFFDGDDPVEFTVRSNEESTEIDIFYFDAVIVVNDTDTLEGKTFLPTESGRYTFKAVVNNLESNVIPVDYVDRKDISTLSFEYEGYDLLTTHPWSKAGDFILNGTLNGSPRIVDFTKSSIPIKFSDGSSTIERRDYRFSQPGTFEAWAEVNGMKTNSITFTVREKKEYEPIEMEIIFHYIKSDPVHSEIERAIASYNEIFTNPSPKQVGTFLSNQWENPNIVNTNMSFRLATQTPDGNTLATPGVRSATAPAEDITTVEQLYDIVKLNNWDPNKYINIYVGPLSIPPSASLPVLEQERLTGLKTADSDEVFGNDTLNYIFNGDTPYNSNMLGRFWGLYSNYDEVNNFPVPGSNCPGIVQAVQTSFSINGMCMDDFCSDTYSYLSRSAPFFDAIGVHDLAVVGDTIPSECFQIARDCNGSSTIFKVKNIMDDPGVDKEFVDNNAQLTARRTRNEITYDQRERMRFVIDHAINRPTPRNQ
ncbi:MAG: hypothetical protein HKN68_14910 [Saprospiraceae bacterium]|nr:hypothetical protein [Saprospiraceae bacterium]